MMELAHSTLVWFSKSFGLFYLIGLSIVAVAYTYWPSNKTQFDRAATSIIEDEDRPWQ
jgi:cytochrome c oxidase cbb3-type subunit 4